MPRLIASAAGLVLIVASGAMAQDARQSGPAPAVKGAPPATRNPASPHPNCVRDKMGKCQPTAAAKRKAQSR